MGLKPNPLDLSSFSALTLLVGSFDPYKPVPDMTYNVFGGKPYSINQSRTVAYVVFINDSFLRCIFLSALIY